VQNRFALDLIRQPPITGGEPQDLLEFIGHIVAACISFHVSD
jgi:hypothetical protein